jgi:hypothetical protein
MRSEPRVENRRNTARSSPCKIFVDAMNIPGNAYLDEHLIYKDNLPSLLCTAAVLQEAMRRRLITKPPGQEDLIREAATRWSHRLTTLPGVSAAIQIELWSHHFGGKGRGS